jgi:hypothetical protein
LDTLLQTRRAFADAADVLGETDTGGRRQRTRRQEPFHPMAQPAEPVDQIRLAEE